MKYNYCHVTVIKGTMAVVEVNEKLASKIGIEVVSVYNLSNKLDKFMFTNVVNYVCTVAKEQHVDITVTRI